MDEVGMRHEDPFYTEAWDSITKLHLDAKHFAAYAQLWSQDQAQAPSQTEELLRTLTDAMAAGWVQHGARLAGAAEAATGVHTLSIFAHALH